MGDKSSKSISFRVISSMHAPVVLVRSQRPAPQLTKEFLPQVKQFRNAQSLWVGGTSRDNACFSTANRPVTAKPSTSPDGDRKRAFTSEPSCSMSHSPSAPAGGGHTAVGQQGVLIITGMAP